MPLPALVPPLERDGAAEEPLRDGDPDGELSTRPRGAEIERLGPITGSGRGVVGVLYERERDSDGSLLGPGSGSALRDVALCRSLLQIRERGAVVSGTLLPARERGAELGAASIRERGESG